MNRGKLIALQPVLASVLALSLTACGPGIDAPTRHVRQVTDGVEAEVNKAGNLIYLRNVYVSVNAAGDATLVATIVNQNRTQDALIALAIGQTQIKITPQPVLQNKPVIFGGDSANATATIPAAGLVAGSRIPVSFFFGLGGGIQVDALIVEG